jgi:hypothetical protein
MEQPHEDYVPISDSTTAGPSSHQAYDHVSISDSATAGPSSHQAHDHVPISDSASVAWLRLGPAVARTGAHAEISVGTVAVRLPSTEPAPEVAPSSAELSPSVVLQLTQRQWDIASAAAGTAIGGVTGGKVGALIGGVIFVAWWRWLLATAKRGKL